MSTSIVPRTLQHPRRGRFLAAIVGLLSPALLVAAPAGASAKPAPEGVAAAAALTEDHSNQMPRTRHNEITGDFLGKGYDQRALVENGNLNIYDSAANGGALLSSAHTDLFEPTTDNEYHSFFSVAWGTMPKDNALAAIPLAWTPGSGFYIAGFRTDVNEHFLYKLPANGSCAEASCAEWTLQLPAFGIGLPLNFGVITTALAAGTIGTRPVLAVGLNTAARALTKPGGTALPSGIYVVDPADGSVLGTYTGYVTPGDPTPVTALDWDDNGSGLLAIGALSVGNRGHAVRVSATGTFTNLTTWTNPTPSLSGPFPLSAAVGHRPDGSPVVAFGTDDGSVKLWDPAVTSSSLLSQVTGSDAVNALTFTDRIDGTVGVPDLVAVSSRGNSARVLRYSGATTLAPLAVAPQGGTSTDVGGIRAWFPGYKTGSVTFENLSVADAEVQLDFATRPNAAFGCWFSHGFGGAPPFPTDSVILDRSSTPTYTVAALTAGQGGDCAATDFTGQWAAYVVATPLGRPADRTVAKLVWSRSGELTVQSVGGSLRLIVLRQPSAQPLGSWKITLFAPRSPGNPTIKVTGKRLDPAGTDRPVYRFDVAATTWPLAVSTPARNQTVIPPLRVRGGTADGTPIDLGVLVPQGQPSRATSGSVTLSPVSFYWQNPAVGQQITSIQIIGGDGLAVSNVVRLADLPTPPVGTLVDGLVVCPATGSTSCDADADPVANGLDQAPLRIQVMAPGSQVLPLTDPVYGQIYYRDQDGDLVTGLIPADGSTYIRVSPYAGAYPNDGSTSSTTRPPTGGTVGGRFGYLSTTTTVEQELTAHVGGSNFASDPIIVDAINLTPQVQPGGEAGSGFYLTGCTGDYTGTNFCRLAQITSTAPGLFLTTDPETSELRIGLQFATTALTSLTSLPLEQVAEQPEHTVAKSPLIINNGEVHLNTTSGFQPADTIDTWLVTHGTQLPIRAIKVGGGN
jgi:hypothetical protein